MKLVLNQELEVVPAIIATPHFINRGLLNSNYQSVVKQNYIKSTSQSIFGIRQRLKSSQFNMFNHTAIILKLTVFALTLIAIF